MIIKKDEEGNCLKLDKIFGWNQMVKIQENQLIVQELGEKNSNVEDIQINYERRLKKNITEGVSEYSQIKKISGNKYVNRVWLIPGSWEYVPLFEGSRQ